MDVKATKTSNTSPSDAARDWIAMVYHDIRSPLANINNSLELLAGSATAGNDSYNLELVQIALRASARIEKLLNTLMDISRLEDPYIPLQNNPVIMDNLVREAIESIMPVIISHHQSIELDLLSGGVSVSGDKEILMRVLLNLLDNASKYSPEGTAIRVGTTASAGEFHFQVTDQGPGIDPADQQAIFEKYTRGNGSQTKKGKGLGLAFCRLAVLAHNGTIGVESTPGAGSSFNVHLPV